MFYFHNIVIKVAETILNIKNIAAQGIIIPDFKLYFRTTAVNRAQCCHKADT